MKETRDQNLGKTSIFSIFLFGSVLLIITIIATDLVKGGSTDGYVRSTPALVTPIGFEETLSAAPTRGRGEGQGHGEGQGQGESYNQGEESPTPTINFTTYPTEDDV